MTWMLASGIPVWLATVQLAALAAILIYDLRRLGSSAIAGEAPLRRCRAVATAVALAALLVFHVWPGAAGAAARGVLAIFGLACIAILWCSNPLKRLVLASRRNQAA